MTTRRLDAETVLRTDGERRALFHGRVSSSTSRIAQVLCDNDAWLRAHLARQGIPVVPTRLVGADDAAFAQRAAEELGFPVRLRLVGAGAEDAPVATDVASFHRAWRELTASEPERGGRVIVEQALPGRDVAEVRVAGEAVVAVAHEIDTAGGELAVRVPPLLGLEQSSVRLVQGRHGGWLVDAVTPASGIETERD